MSRARSRRRPSGGFTLLEMMIAVAILAMIMATLFGAFHAVALGKTQGEQRLEGNREAGAILWLLTNELRGAVQTPLVPSRVLLLGSGHMYNAVPVDSVVFSTFDSGHRPALDGFGPEEIVSYTTRPNPERRGCFYLLRGQWAGTLPDPPPRQAVTAVALTDSLLELHIRYFDGIRWNESWDSRMVPPGRQLPAGVSVELTMAMPSGRPLSLSSQVMLPLAFVQW